MKKILFVYGPLGIIVSILGIWFLLHILARPPFHPPLPNPTLSLIVEPRDGMAPVLSLINNATTTVDLVMYELTDTDIEKALVTAKSRGLTVRVLLNKGYYGAQSASSKAPANQAAYDYLQNNGVSVRWTPSTFSLTHEKLLIADGDALIMGFNLTPAYYPTSRDFAVNNSDANDVSALEKVFNADWNGESIAAPEANDLVWSPHSGDEMVSLIKHAKHSLLIYNEEMGNRAMIEALKNAASRGVSINIIMTYQSTWKSAFFKLIASGVHIHARPEKAPLYIHAKMIVVDNNEAFVGSQNFSDTSLNTNRELGILITKPSIIASLLATFGSDWTMVQ